jgi:hypothetical protein
MEGREAARSLTVAAAAAILFGGLTIASGGRALFGGPEVQIALGDIVPFVLWFNFVAGFAYIAAGIGLFRRNVWGVWLSATIAGATLVAFAAFGVHVLAGGAYETRTVGAMALRSVVWIAIASMAAHVRRGGVIRPAV